MHKHPTTRNLEHLEFGSRFVAELPADPETRNFPRQVLGACYSHVTPTRVAAPSLITHSSEMLDELGLNREAVDSASFAEVLAGNRLLPGMTPHATCYGGHQFGHWAGQLGDGRAINLGEVRGASGQFLTLQLKGAGRTPYSRTADGLAVLRSSIREFLCSEAMHHLGIPTTRALSLVSTGETVIRDMFYDGNPRPEPGAIVCRVAPSFTRFGHFEIFAARGEIDPLRRLVDFTVRHDFPHIQAKPSIDTTLDWFAEVCRRTAELIVEWQRVGFVHGVMNTDNLSILGLTIDYGPYGWIDDYNPDWTPNTTDAAGRRYRFGHQPRIAHWNLVRLAQALHPLIGAVEPLQAALDEYPRRFESGWRDMMARKLGFRSYEPASDDELTEELLKLLPMIETDMTIFYRQLAQIGPELADAAPETLVAPIAPAWYQPDAATPEYRARLLRWLRDYCRRLQSDGSLPDTRIARMNAANPCYVLRNYLAQMAIDRTEQGDASLIGELLEVLRHPYDAQPGQERFADKRPDWARQRAGCSMLSCSS
jgi:uncharacterized protein YdiU (UPF0061 family)